MAGYNRVSTHLPNDNMRYYSRIRETHVNQQSSKIASQSRILNLRDNPIAAAHSVRYASYMNRLKQYNTNLENGIHVQRTSENYLRETIDITHRIREIAIQGANSTINAEQRAYLSTEVNQLLEQLVNIVNSKDDQGHSIFAGEVSYEEPFLAVRGNQRDFTGSIITDVQYFGNIQSQNIEIGDGTYIDTNILGNYAFWANNNSIISQTTAHNYIALENSELNIDGTSITITTGDNINTIIDKINNSTAPIRAEVDEALNSLSLTTTTPHQIWLEDKTGTVLSDLGLIKADTSTAPHNIAETAITTGSSLFDTVIDLRNSLHENQVLPIGGTILENISNSIDNLLSHVTITGARTERMETTQSRIMNKELPNIIQQHDQEIGLDLTQAAITLKELELAQQSTLAVTGRVIQNTLLDFLR